MTVHMMTAQLSFEEMRKRYSSTILAFEEQKYFFLYFRRVIKSKDQYIKDIKEKYKAKKNQINKEINKLKTFWQTGAL